MDLPTFRRLLSADGQAALAAAVAAVPTEATLLACHRRLRKQFPDDLVKAALEAAFGDPDRRAGGKRHLRPGEYSPPLDTLRARFAADFPLGVKVAPGVSWDDLRPLDAEAEFVSVGGELKECCLWFGPLRGAGRR